MTGYMAKHSACVPGLILMQPVFMARYLIFLNPWLQWTKLKVLSIHPGTYIDSVYIDFSTNGYYNDTIYNQPITLEKQYYYA